MTKRIPLLVTCLLLGYALIVHAALQMLAAGIGVVFGANIDTTAGAWRQGGLGCVSLDLGVVSC